MGRLRAGSAPLDHKDGSASLDRGAIRERRSYWLGLAAHPPLTPREKTLLLGPKGNQALVGPSNCVVFFASFALFFVNVLALYFCIIFFASFALFLCHSFCSIQM